MQKQKEKVKEEPKQQFDWDVYTQVERDYSGVTYV